MRHYCTYFDHNYLAKGLALYRSLARHGRPFRLWVLCLSDACHAALKALAAPEMALVSLGELERFDPGLPGVKSGRSLVEYYFTCTPILPRYVMAADASVDWLTYLDSDLWFLESPEAVFAELDGGSIGIIRHGFTEDQREKEAFGIYNVGWISFRRSKAGMDCLSWWRDRCIEWCHDRLEPGRFADQKYLDEWPGRFDGVVEIRHPGANLAPWNIRARRLEWGAGGWRVDGQPLLFFHFHGVRRVTDFIYDTALETYGVEGSGELIGRLFRPYLREVRQCTGQARELLKGVGNCFAPPPSRIYRPGNPIRFWWFALQQLRRGSFVWVSRGSQSP